MVEKKPPRYFFFCCCCFHVSTLPTKIKFLCCFVQTLFSLYCFVPGQIDIDEMKGTNFETAKKYFDEVKSDERRKRNITSSAAWVWHDSDELLKFSNDGYFEKYHERYIIYLLYFTSAIYTYIYIQKHKTNQENTTNVSMELYKWNVKTLRIHNQQVGFKISAKYLLEHFLVEAILHMVGLTQVYLLPVMLIY